MGQIAPRRREWLLAAPAQELVGAARATVRRSARVQLEPVGGATEGRGAGAPGEIQPETATSSARGGAAAATSPCS